MRLPRSRSAGVLATRSYGRASPSFREGAFCYREPASAVSPPYALAAPNAALARVSPSASDMGGTEPKSPRNALRANFSPSISPRVRTPIRRNSETGGHQP